MTTEPLPIEAVARAGRPAEPRLLALRVQGFKSFAERTNV